MIYAFNTFQLEAVAVCGGFYLTDEPDPAKARHYNIYGYSVMRTIAIIQLSFICISLGLVCLVICCAVAMGGTSALLESLENARNNRFMASTADEED